MRIIAGTFGGRRLETPRGARTRPTADRVKESLFGILGVRCEGARVLDLYAGSGALGLEALSRRAREAVFVEDDAAAVRALAANIARLEVTDRTQVLRTPAVRAIAGLRGSFDLVFLDPPYGRDLARDTLTRLAARGALLAVDARVVAEHSRRDVMPDRVGALARVDERRYGDTVLSFYGAAIVEVET